MLVLRRLGTVGDLMRFFWRRAQIPGVTYLWLQGIYRRVILRGGGKLLKTTAESKRYSDGDLFFGMFAAGPDLVYCGQNQTLHLDRYSFHGDSSFMHRRYNPDDCAGLVTLVVIEKWQVFAVRRTIINRRRLSGLRYAMKLHYELADAWISSPDPLTARR